MHWNFDLLNWLKRMMGADLSINLELMDETKELSHNNSLIRTSNFQHHSFITHLPVYTQVFADRIGFQPNVSVLDLLFNEGKRSLTLLHS
jgi:hypothetical protein